MEPLDLSQVTDSAGTSFVQDYTSAPIIDGVKVIELKNHIGEGGDFSELMRVTSNGEMESVPGFNLRQVNRSSMLPGTVKAWHFHLSQEDVWYVPPSGNLLVGLWDLRKNSTTSDVKMRLTLGAGTSRLLLIPRGVAHGAANLSMNPVELFYFMNQQFDIKNPDEHRLPWDAAGRDEKGKGFWMWEKA